MKSHPFAVLLAVALIVLGVGNLPVFAQTAPLSADTPSGPVQLSDADLQQLVAPIALYPDPMLALILQASTVPTDIVLANRWLTNGGDEDDIDSQPWDDSVKGLAHYPDVLQMMDDNLDWTNQLGAAVLAQQADVMRAVQAMRAKAQAQGNLQTTAQQQVVTQGSTIEIVPASPQVIYVPVYDPTVIYYQPAPPIVFGPSFSIGIWLGGGCNWNSYYFYRSGFYRPGYGWGYRPGTARRGVRRRVARRHVRPIAPANPVAACPDGVRLRVVVMAEVVRLVEEIPARGRPAAASRVRRVMVRIIPAGPAMATVAAGRPSSLCRIRAAEIRESPANPAMVPVAGSLPSSLRRIRAAVPVSPMCVRPMEVPEVATVGSLRSNR